jgi:5-methylcytosine-specific restriction endonuclease McrA
MRGKPNLALKGHKRNGDELTPNDIRKYERHSIEYRQWRIDVFERDDYTCRICGVRGGVLRGHHIRPWALFPYVRYDVTNGATLCDPCHKRLHRGQGPKELLCLSG